MKSSVLRWRCRPPSRRGTANSNTSSSAPCGTCCRAPSSIAASRGSACRSATGSMASSAPKPESSSTGFAVPRISSIAARSTACLPRGVERKPGTCSILRSGGRLMSPPEDSYGCAKGFDFICASIKAYRPREILDIGCGVGTQLTAPLAAAFPAIRRPGVDKDARSLDGARAHVGSQNRSFVSPAELPADHRFALVIASEVLEHVEDPGQFLRQLAARLTPSGRLILTVPNGYGVFEWMALAEVLLNLSGIQAVLRRLKRRRMVPDESMPATLANSPHINFFSFRELGRLFTASGLVVDRYRARTLLRGYLIDSI